MARGILGSLGSFLGSFATEIFDAVQSIGGHIADALGLGREAGANPAVEVVEQEWLQAARATDLEPSFTTLKPYDFVPHEWYVDSDIPWNRPFSYKVNLYGRDLDTGRFTSQDFDITVSRELTLDEIEDEAISRLGATGESPAIEIFSAKVIGASKRAGEQPW